MASRRGRTSSSRRSTQRSANTNTGTSPNARKGRDEARIERLTWFGLVLVFAVFGLLRERGETALLPNFLLPLLAALILLGSGVYQNTRRYRVSPVTWIGGTILFMFAAANLTYLPTWNLTSPALLVVAGVILFGVLTGES